MTDDSALRLVLPQVLLPQDLINLLHMTNTTLHVLLEDKSFPLVTIGNQSFVLRESFLDWLRAQERPSLLPQPN